MPPGRGSVVRRNFYIRLITASADYLRLRGAARTLYVCGGGCGGAKFLVPPYYIQHAVFASERFFHWDS